MNRIDHLRALKDHGYHPIPARKEGDLFLQLLGPTFISTTSVMMRASALERVGPYDEALVAEDYDMFLRLSRVYLWKYLPYPLVYYRALTTSLSDSSKFHARRRTDRIRILRKHIGTSPESDRIIIEKVSHSGYPAICGRPRKSTRYRQGYVALHETPANGEGLPGLDIKCYRSAGFIAGGGKGDVASLDSEAPVRPTSEPPRATRIRRLW